VINLPPTHYFWPATMRRSGHVDGHASVPADPPDIGYLFH
jgi:hypothetical protein